MRVLLVSEDLPVATLGGAGKHAVLLGNTLLDAGHEVQMLGRLRAPGVEGKNDFRGPLHCAIDLAGTGWQEYRFGAFLPGRREHAARRVWQAIRAFGVDHFDIIHYHGHLTALGAIVPAAVPFVQTLHDQGSECLTMMRFRAGAPCAETDPRACAGCATARPNALQTALSAAAARRLRERSVLAFARHETIFVSDFLRQRFMANVRPAAPLRAHVIHNFTDVQRLDQALAAPLPPVPDSRPVALLVGRIDAAKGFADFLAAVPDALLAHWRVRVVGTGPLLAALQAQHAPRGVEFTGWLGQQDTYRETAAATLCIVPSLVEEAFGTTTLEALALGRPTLALARGATPELARYERYPGQLMLQPDIAALVQAFAQAPEQPRPRSTEVMSAADVRRKLPDIVAVYDAALAAHRP